jgi:hypothetical protein
MERQKTRLRGRLGQLQVEFLEERRMLSVTAVPDNYQVLTNQLLAIGAPRGLLSNDVGTNLTAVLANGPASGNLQLQPNGAFAYLPAQNYVGLVTFSYRAVSGTEQSDPATVSIQVQPPTDQPIVAKNDDYAVAPNHVLTVDAAHSVLVNDLAPPGTQLTASVVSQPLNGQLQFNADGTFTYTPADGFMGTDTFTYTATDGTFTSNAATVTILVTGPTAVDDQYQTPQDQPLVVDAEHGVLSNDLLGPGGGTATLVASPQNGSVQLNSDGSFTYTPTAGYVGPDVFTYTATTANGDTTNVAQVNIAVLPNVSVHAADDVYQVAQNQTLSVDADQGVLANDFKLPGATLTATLVSAPVNGTLQLNSDGSFTYTPNSDFLGADIFTYTASDGTTTSNTATVTVNVHPAEPPPVQAVDDFYAVDPGGTLQVDAAQGVLANDHFGGGTPPTVTLAGPPSNGSLTLNADGSFTYTPNAGFTGLDAFTYTDNSGATASNTATVVIQVQQGATLHAANDIYSIPENGTLTVGVDHGVLSNDPHVPGTTLTAALVTGPVNGSLTLNSDGSFTYTPNAGFTGADTFSYQANDGTSNSNVAVATIYVLPADHQPPTAVDDFYSGTPGTPLVVTAADGVLDNDVSNGATLTATLVNQPANGTVTLNSDGSFTYTPNANFQGNDVFTYQDSDGTTTSNVAAVHVRIHSDATNPPLAVPDVYEVLQDTTLTIDANHGVLSNDYSGNGAALTATIGTEPVNGTLTLNSDGSFTYTPTAGFTGNDSFTYTANNGVADSNVATVTIHVLPPIALPPVAVKDTYATAPGQALVTDAANGVLNNDIAANGATLTATLVAGPANGTLTLNSDGSFTYTPNAGYTGVDVFTYMANDGTSNSNVAPVYIAVTANASGPIAFNDTYTVTGNSPLTVTAANGVLSNDHGNSLTATLLTTTLHGDLVFNSDGSFTYTPDATFQGIDTFSYTASDGQSTSKPAIVLLTRHAWNNAADPGDVNGDGTVDPLDALTVINELNSGGIRALPAVQANSPDELCDVNADDMLTPADALMIINQLNDPSGGTSSSTSSDTSAKIEQIASLPSAASASVGAVPGVATGLQGLTVETTVATPPASTSSVAPAAASQAAVKQAIVSLDAQTASLDSVLNDLALDVYLAQGKQKVS